MIIEKQRAYIEDMYGEPITKEKGVKIMKALEKKGRNCYKSEGAITDESYKSFLKNRVQRDKHESIIEHCSVSAFITTNKAIETEIVRHRIASYSISSTRYCNFSKDKFQNQIRVIHPMEITPEWLSAMEAAEKSYISLTNKGLTPDKVRGTLPLDILADVWMTTNLREWRHFFNMRCSKAAHFQIREIAFILLKQFNEVLPEIFSDIYDTYKDDIDAVMEE